MDLEKDVYTTFEAADICNANITSIKNWIDGGELQAFKTPGGHYRIERKVLDNFLNRHEMPNPFARREQKRILWIHSQEELLEELESELGDQHHYESTADPVDALLRLGQWKPDAAVVDAELDELDAVELCQSVGEYVDLANVDLVVVYNGGDEREASLREAGADYLVERDGGSSEIFGVVEQAIQ